MVIQNLIENLKKPSEPKKINLIIDGGAFKIGYIYGALLYLKELENQKFITIEKISGTSAGAILGILYLINRLDEYNKLYKTLRNIFQNSLEFQTFFDIFIKEILEKEKNICEVLNNKIYINYFDINNKKEIIKSTYKSKEDILKCIKNTSYIPIFTNGNLSNCNNIDGVIPHLFYDRDISNPKNLMLNLHNVGSYKQIVNTKNETNCENRRLMGILEIHHFFFHNEKSKMCSYIENWTPKDFLIYRTRATVRLVIGYVIFFIITINNYMPIIIKNNIFFIKIVQNFRQLFLDYFIYFIIN